SVRNLILNWIVIIPVFCTLIIVLKLIAVLSDWATRVDDDGLTFFQFKVDQAVFEGAFAVAGVTCLILALSFVTRSRPTRRTIPDKGPNQKQFMLRALLPSFLSAGFLAQFLASDYIGQKLLHDGPGLVPEYPLAVVLAGGAACGVLIYAGSWLAARVVFDLK